MPSLVSVYVLVWKFFIKNCSIYISLGGWGQSGGGISRAIGKIKMCQFNSFSYFFFTPSLITKCTRIVCLIRKTIFVKLIYITASIDLTKHFMKHIGMPPYINFQNFFKSMIFINKHLSKYSTRFWIFSFIRQDFWNTLFAITTSTYIMY